MEKSLIFCNKFKYSVIWFAGPSEGAPIGAPGLELAAAAVVIAAAAVIIIVTAAQAVIAATAEQEQQDDDPAPVTTAETIVIHNEYLQVFFAAKPLIPRYSMVRILCNGDAF